MGHVWDIFVKKHIFFQEKHDGHKNCSPVYYIVDYSLLLLELDDKDNWFYCRSFL